MGSLLRVCEKDQDEYEGEVLCNFYSKGREGGTMEGRPLYGIGWNIHPARLDRFVGDKLIKGRSKGPMTLAEFKKLLEESVVEQDFDCIGRLA